jgi:hypothetical protein
MLAIMPFLNQNNNSVSNVMAQEYDKYRDSSYSQHPTDDTKNMNVEQVRLKVSLSVQ